MVSHGFEQACCTTRAIFLGVPSPAYRNTAKRTQHYKKESGAESKWQKGETRCGQQIFMTACVEIIVFIWSSLSELLTTTGLNFIGGDDDDVTILWVDERGSTKL